MRALPDAERQRLQAAAREYLEQAPKALQVRGRRLCRGPA